MSKPWMEYRYDLCENEIQCDGRTIAYAEHSIFDIKNKEEFGVALRDLGMKLGWLIHRANAVPELLSVAHEAPCRCDWRTDKAGGSRVMITQCERCAAIAKAEGGDA